MEEEMYLHSEYFKEISKIGAVRLIADMFSYFSAKITGGSVFGIQLELSSPLARRMFNNNTRNSFKEWIHQFGRQQDLSGSRDNFEEFKTLLTSHDSMLLSYYLYRGWRFLFLNRGSISIRSSDHVVFEMKKMAATTQSVVLKDLIDSTGGGDEIPVPGESSLILSQAASFCEKKHNFDTQFDIIAELSKSTEDSYKAWITGFVKNNQSIFPHLHNAADYLDIPSLLELTSCAMGGMKKGSTIEEISECYSTLSIPGAVLRKGGQEKMKSNMEVGEASQSDSKLSGLSGTELQRDPGKERCEKRHEKVAAAVLKGRGEELQGLYDTEIEGFQKSEKFQDLMSAVYLNGLRDGVLEAQAMLLALDMDRT